MIEGEASLYFNDPIKVDYSPIFMAVKIGHVGYIEMMCDALDNGEIDTFYDSQGYSPVMLAVKLGMHDIVNYLTLRGINLEQEDPS